MDADCKTLWMGDIQLNWDEAYIGSLFASAVEQPSIKLIRDKVTGYPAGYGFLEFPSQQGAQAVLNTFNGQIVPNTIHRFRLNWGAGGRRIDTVEDHSIFVGDLAPEVSDELLLSTFSTRFSSVRGAKVVIDPVTRMPKGFGFVRFGDKGEADQALQTMNGVYCSSRPMRVSVATDRTKTRGIMPPPISYPVVGTGNTEEEGANTTVFIGGLDPSTTEDDLRARFGVIGEIMSVKVPPGRGCGFVQYVTKDAADVAINQMNGALINGVKVRCAWGRSAAARLAGSSVPAAGYYQQYPYQQPAYQNAYGYNYFPQGYAQQPGSYTYNAYGGYPQAEGMASAYNQQASITGQSQSTTHGGANSQMLHQPYQGSQRRDPFDNSMDFTRPDDDENLNRNYVAKHAYQYMPPAMNASYSPISAHLAKGTAMERSS
ncbi:unnamed protein product [Albugo candida]|uniref:RRM domain-containing protein n=2 Tax=Albugo candida TaxID=65357 RepID=A0A024G9R8_9STRA|nr:unnamed protein product [Albugo candida]|eukprot:CCI43077.1 unnamed protein product [Albugo candida]